MRATPQAIEQQQSTLRTEPYCTVPNAPPGFSGSSGLIGRRQFKYATSWKLQARCGQGEHASHGMLGRKTHSRGWAIQCDMSVRLQNSNYQCTNWLTVKLLFKKRPPRVRPGANPQNEVYTPATTSSTRWSTTQPRIAFCRQQYVHCSLQETPKSMVNSIASCWL